MTHDIEDAKGLKAKATEELRRLLPAAEERLGAIDERVRSYICGIDGDPEGHNLYEIMGACKFLRMLGEYYFDQDAVRRIYSTIEGVWEPVGDKGWRHVSGGFRLTSIRGERYYRMTPLQCFLYAGIYGFKAYVDLGPWDGVTELLPSECVNPADGHVLDLRRVVTDMCFFAPRKVDKSGLAANVAVLDFLLGDVDNEAYVCTNGQTQSLELLRKVRDRLAQLDPSGRRLRFTQKEITWKLGQSRSGRIVALSAGAKTKDGLKASLCLKDEYGAAAYANGKSDMAQLVQVVESSMGPRRQPLSVTTTTAGLVQAGPFQMYLEGVKEILKQEMA